MAQSMTREEYEKLVKSSFSFKEMSPGVQAAILAAEGEEMERYIKMFQEEQQYLTQAYQDFQKETDKIVTDYKTEVKKDKKEALVKKEEKVQSKEEKAAEKLLNNL